MWHQMAGLSSLKQISAAFPEQLILLNWTDNTSGTRWNLFERKECNSHLCALVSVFFFLQLITRHFIHSARKCLVWRSVMSTYLSVTVPALKPLDKYFKNSASDGFPGNCQQFCFSARLTHNDKHFTSGTWTALCITT